MNYRPSYKHEGFTLIELLVGIALSTGVILVVTYFALDITKLGLFLGERLETERDLERTLREFVTEVRSMGPSANGSYPIAEANRESFTFYTDVDSDGMFEQVRYFLNGTTLQKATTEPTGSPAVYSPADEVVRDVVPYIVPGSDMFTFWDQGFIGEIASLSTPADVSLIRLVRMRATVDKDPALPPSESTQSVHITIRNLRGEI